jgi:hypothetical protein
MESVGNRLLSAGCWAQVAGGGAFFVCEGAVRDPCIFGDGNNNRNHVDFQLHQPHFACPRLQVAVAGTASLPTRGVSFDGLTFAHATTGYLREQSVHNHILEAFRTNYFR